MIILMESDLEQAMQFYQKLGFKLLFHLKNRWAEFILDTVQIGLCPTVEQPVDRCTGIVLEVDDVKQFYELYKDDITFVGQPTAAIHGVMTGIKDPGGNIIDIYQPTPDRVKEVVGKVATVGKSGCCKEKSNENKVAQFEKSDCVC